ncbi:hypothetical protein BDW_12490 [Bdellovibrio bacteriovorus W]|nr:hypothetical protein BDW_12490 [Bdellovibrio bacteriovorus W]
MKRLIQSVLLTVTALLMVNCGSESNSNNNSYYPTCPSGQYWNGYVCQNGNSNGVYPTNGTVRYYDYNRYNGVSNGDMRIVNTGAYKEFLKQAMAVCDQYTWSAGLAKCDSWASGSFQLDVTIDTSSNPPRPSMMFTARPMVNGYINYTLSAGINQGGVGFNPLYLMQNNTFSLINNSKGFEIRGYGSYYNGGGLKLIQIQVLNGTLADGYFTYDLYFPYNGVATKIATGRLKRR